jgi:archaellum component FlaF (FlaF/FlaG flagellin family)
MTTVLGTLLFIGIIFTSLIPMQLVMMQSDIIESQILQELELDEGNKEQESISLVSYPTATSSDQLKIRVQNKGSIDVVLSKLWIKDESISLNETIIISQIKVLGPFTVPLVQNTSYPVKVITERGNVFGSDAGNMIFSSQGIWYTPSLGVNVYIANDKGKYFVKVSNSTWDVNYTTKGQDFGDVIVLFDVDTLDTYHVVCKKNNEDGPHLPGTPVDVEISWPNGSPIAYVYTSGYDT